MENNSLFDDATRKLVEEGIKEAQRRILVTVYPEGGIKVSEIDEFCDILREMKQTALNDYPNDDVAVMIFTDTEFKRIQDEMEKIPSPNTLTV